MGPGLDSTPPSLVTLCTHPFVLSRDVGGVIDACGRDAVQACVVVVGSAPCQDPCLGYKVTGGITLYKRRATMFEVYGWCMAKYLQVVQRE